ncbi:glyceraldehyde-3-phosphate dehydrogenase, type I, partial [Salmonella enterica subsp. enterica serovar Heidelberg str. RI-11-014588]
CCVVAEATGIFLTDETARKHITAGDEKSGSDGSV